MISAGAAAAAIVPVWANGELRGVLGLAWAERRVFDEDERAFVLTLGVMCAQAIMRAHLRVAEKAASHASVLAQEVAELANKSKAHYLATISHDLRTPMNAVIGYTQPPNGRGNAFAPRGLRRRCGSAPMRERPVRFSSISSATL